MKIIVKIVEMIDPFLWQLFIVPLIVIGLGVLVSALTRKIFVGPIITLILNVLYEVWYIKYYLQASKIKSPPYRGLFYALLFSIVATTKLLEPFMSIADQRIAC
jgi:hypothetical protein